jgi:hypothetical protein
MTKAALVVFALVMVVPSLAGAQQGAKPNPPVKRSDDCAEQRKKDKQAVCTLNIEGVSLDGKVIGPDGMQATGRVAGGRSSLLRLRTDFVDNIVRDAANL